MKSSEGRLGRWTLFLQDLDFFVQHVKGKENVVADALSRCCILIENKQEE